MSNDNLVEKQGGRTCCIVGCNSRYSKNAELSFYAFPNRPWEQDRKKKWIAAVRRKSQDGKNWVPSKHSKICSAHFEGGKKSNNPNDTSYYPSIFPNIYGRKLVKIDREKRVIARRNKREISPLVSANTEDNDGSQGEVESSIPNFLIENFTTVGTQTDPDFTISNEDISMMFCSQNSTSNEVSIQTNIVINKPSEARRKKIVIAPKIVHTRSVSVGSDESYRPGFTGFDNMVSDKEMKRFGGLTLSVFKILLKFIRPGKHGQPKFFKTLNAENRLLLFLIKMKTGLSLAVIGGLFQVSPTTASSIFKSVLNSLYENVKTWVFWPSKEAVRATLPYAFKLQHPNCRAIIDCTEIQTDSPPTVEQRILMYSNYKSNFTIKFLIAISPCGLITFVSKGYGGRSTDGFIVNDSGFINLVEPGDVIMADKGFPQITTELLQRDCVLVMPPFADNPQFTKEEVARGYSIARVRIHVERAIQRIKIF